MELKEERTIGEMLSEAKRKLATGEVKGHDIMALERFDPEVKHMVIFKVLSDNCPAGNKGDRMRLFLTDEGYKKCLEDQKRGRIEICNHAKVASGGHLHYNRQDRELQM